MQGNPTELPPGAAYRPWVAKPRNTTKINPRTRQILDQGEDAFVPSNEVTKYYSLSSACLRRWAEKGEVRTRRLGDRGKRLYNAKDLKLKIVAPTSDDLISNPNGESSQTRKKIACARVSSAHQRGDLDRQIQLLKRLCPDHELITDVARYCVFCVPFWIFILNFLIYLCTSSWRDSFVAVASTGTGKAYAPFWTNASREWSKKLPCFTGTDWRALPLNS